MAFQSNRVARNFACLKEAVTVPLETGQLVIVYSGRDGSYQWNRPHFADFLKNLSTGEG